MGNRDLSSDSNPNDRLGAAAIVAAAPIIPWEGSVWRCHDRRFPSNSWQGSLLFSGRFHRAPDLFPTEFTWPALYTATGPEVALGEAIRYQAPRMRRIAAYDLSEVALRLTSVVDVHDLAGGLIDEVHLLDDWDYTLAQECGEAALRRRADGLLVPSATRLGNNVIVLPGNLSAATRIDAVVSRSLMHVLRYGADEGYIS